MPALEQLASTLQGRRDLLYVYSANRSEVALYLCVREYENRRTKTRALTIHNLFLEKNSAFYCEHLMPNVGAVPYQNWLTREFYPNIVESLGTAMGMPAFFRKFTSFTRVPPRNLFDIFKNTLRRQFPVHFARTEEEWSLMVRAAKDGLRLMSRGQAGGQTFAGREQMGIRRARKWSSDLAFAMTRSGQFDPNALGITNVYSDTNLA